MNPILSDDLDRPIEVNSYKRGVNGYCGFTDSKILVALGVIALVGCTIASLFCTPGSIPYICFFIFSTAPLAIALIRLGICKAMACCKEIDSPFRR